MNLHAISLDNHEFEGENNAYLLESAGELALIDTGFQRPDVRDALVGGLTELGYEPGDLDRVVLTHHHFDHSGLAGELTNDHGTPVVVHEDDAPLIERDRATIERWESLHARRFEEWGMPETKREELLAFFEAAPPVEPPETIETITGGDVIEVGEWMLETRHAPGHTAGHCLFSFERAGKREVFVGDAILPVYTPNVGGADLRVERPLERYLETLSAIRSGSFRRAWPGHREQIEDPAGRAETIAEHHHERTENVLEVLESAGPSTVWEVSDALFGALENIHILHGPGEAFAHLDHLERAGAVERTDGRYRRAEGAVDIEEILSPSS